MDHFIRYVAMRRRYDRHSGRLCIQQDDRCSAFAVPFLTVATGVDKCVILAHKFVQHAEIDPVQDCYFIEDFPFTVDFVNLDQSPDWFLEAMTDSPQRLAGEPGAFQFFQGVVHGIQKRHQAA